MILISIFLSRGTRKCRTEKISFMSIFTWSIYLIHFRLVRRLKSYQTFVSRIFSFGIDRYQLDYERYSLNFFHVDIQPPQGVPIFVLLLGWITIKDREPMPHLSFILRSGRLFLLFTRRRWTRYHLEFEQLLPIPFSVLLTITPSPSPLRL